MAETKLKWFEREFDFNIPPEEFPGIIERLQGTPERLEDAVSSLTRDILTRQVNDKWSIQENVGHLLDLETLHDGRIDDFINNEKVLRAADLKNRKTFEANHNTKEIKSLLNSFRTARMNFVRRLENLDEDILFRTAVHPRLNKQMSIIDMAFFIAEHDEHHLATITELKNIKLKKY